MPVSVKKKKKKKRISKLWILGRKESFRFLFFVDLKKKRLEANAIPSHTTPGRGKNSSGQMERKTQREMVEVGRDLKGRETKVRRWMRDRFLQNNFILYIWQLKLFCFCLSMNCLLLIFFLLFNLCGFFLLSFVFFVCLFVFFVILCLVFC